MLKRHEKIYDEILKYLEQSFYKNKNLKIHTIILIKNLSNIEKRRNL